jgi:hypothetical protein
MDRTDNAKGNIWPESDRGYIEMKKRGEFPHWSVLDLAQYCLSSLGDEITSLSVPAGVYESLIGD